MEWYYPKNENCLEDHSAAHRARMWQFGVFAHPLFFGDYPEDVKRGVLVMNQSNGITLNRLLNFSENEKKLIKGELNNNTQINFNIIEESWLIITLLTFRIVIYLKNTLY